jgi:filamentous hemagglutinin family protein
MKRASLNHTYRLVWSDIAKAFIAVSEATKGKGKKSRVGRSLMAIVSTLFMSSTALAADLPTGGQIVGGSGTISQSGNVMTINQATAKMAADWQSFSIGSGKTVNFVQPSSSSVAMNRVLGADVSVIQGALNANGQVFLINPNGVLFTPTAQVNVGGTVASTLNMSTADFMVGNYKFEGNSSNAIINQGNITAVNGGTIALIAAKIINDGTLNANNGNVLLGAGSKVTLDMGGPVKLRIENDALETLIQNGGAIKADGGTVWLTSQATTTLASSVINNTGLIEAQTLATGEKGEIVLFAHDGIANVGGRLDASAPNGGDGGFIETSGARVVNDPRLTVTTLAPYGQTGTWLIDPLTYTVAASGGDETGAALAGRLAGTNIQIQADNTVNINDAVSWSANRLTLTSGGDININSTLTATGAASLALEYGQSSASGTGNTYTVATGANMYIPLATAFTWKKGSAGTTNNLVFANASLRFGNGTQASLNSNGLLEQPWYFDNTSIVSGTQRNDWFKLTFSNFALNLEVAAGGVGTSDWNRNGSILSSQQGTFATAMTSRQFNIAGFKEGTGSIISSVNLTFGGGETVRVDNTYTLGATAQFVKTDTTMTNTGGAAASNLRLWVGTQDDYVATRDSQFKSKGNLTSNGFEQIAAQTDQAKALKITEFNDGTGAAILFYSTSDGADTSFAGCCSFSNSTGINPRSSRIANVSAEDGSYALFIRLADLAAGQSDGMTWYYAAAPAAQINNVVTAVATSAGVVTPPTPTPTPSSVPQTTAIGIAPAAVSQHGNSEPATFTSSELELSGGLNFVEVKNNTQTSGSAQDSDASSDVNVQIGGQEANNGFLKVFVVNGGIHLLEQLFGIEEDDNRREN